MSGEVKIAYLYPQKAEQLIDTPGISWDEPLGILSFGDTVCNFQALDDYSKILAISQFNTDELPINANIVSLHMVMDCTTGAGADVLVLYRWLSFNGARTDNPGSFTLPDSWYEVETIWAPAPVADYPNAVISPLLTEDNLRQDFQIQLGFQNQYNGAEYVDVTSFNVMVKYTDPILPAKPNGLNQTPHNMRRLHFRR
jgi:hypothetical protein